MTPAAIEAARRRLLKPLTDEEAKRQEQVWAWMREYARYVGRSA